MHAWGEYFVIADTKTKHAGSQHQSMSEASVECQSKDFTISIQHVTLSIWGPEKLSFIILLCLFISLCNAFYDWNANHIILCNIIAAVNNDITCYLGNIRMLLIVMLPR